MLDKITSSTDSRHKEDYRPDIDGLRAVAVLSVALYHLNIIHHLTGGFLGVEEQFYFVWPLALSLLWRRRPVWLAIFVGAVFLLSLAAAQWTVASDQNLAFYLSPFRAFEFAVGASVLWAPQLKRQLARELGLAVGLILIVYSLFAYTAQSPMPGFETLVPTVGAALVIYCGEARLGILLRNWPARWIGRISYSLYLVHWPILVFAQYILMRDLTRLEAVLAFFVSVAVAWLMLVFVETPFRQRDGRAFRISSRRLHGIPYVDASSYLCHDGTCANFNDGKPLYSDATHLSIWGSDLLAKEMWPAVLDKLEAG